MDLLVSEHFVEVLLQVRLQILEIRLLCSLVLCVKCVHFALVSTKCEMNGLGIHPLPTQQLSQGMIHHLDPLQ